MKKKLSALHWQDIWEQFDAWIADHRKVHFRECGKCHHVDDFGDPEWPDQQDAIEDIVEKAIKARGRKRT